MRRRAVAHLVNGSIPTLSGPCPARTAAQSVARPPAGANSSVVGSQAAQTGYDAVTGRDVTGKDQPVREGWWARLRKWCAVVTFATIIGAVATVVGAVAGVCVWIGWTP